jgi:hypothetical protein
VATEVVVVRRTVGLGVEGSPDGFTCDGFTGDDDARAEADGVLASSSVVSEHPTRATSSAPASTNRLTISAT